MPELAQELLALIADIIAESGDRETLARLALVNGQLLNLVRERRSSELVIGGPSFHAKPQNLLGYLQKFHSLIQADPTFADSIITLTLSHDTDSAANAVEMNWGYSTMGWLGWTEVTEVISQILPQLSYLRSLTITAHEPDAFTDWTNVPPDMQDALFHCFSLSTMEELVLERIINMEITPLIDCPSLTTLSLIGITLEVGDCGTALEKLLEGFERDDARLSISELKSLTVHAAMYNDTMKHAMKRLLQRTGNSIEELRIRIPVTCDRDVKELKLFELFRELQQFPLLAFVEIEVALSWCAGVRHDHALRIPYSLEPIGTIIRAIRRCDEKHVNTARLSFNIDPYPVGTWSRRYGSNRINTSDVAKAIIESDLWETLESEFGNPSHGETTRIEVAIGTPLVEGLQEAAKEAELLKRDVVVEGVYRRMPTLTKTGIVNAYCLVNE